MLPAGGRPEEDFVVLWGLMRNATRWLCFLLCASGVAIAQNTNSGDIRGTVTDSSGALLPGVKITVLNVDTGVSKDYTTDSAGLYDTSSIVAGNYTLTFQIEGFDRLVRGPVTVQVGVTNREWPVKSRLRLARSGCEHGRALAQNRIRRAVDHPGRRSRCRNCLRPARTGKTSPSCSPAQRAITLLATQRILVR